MRSGKHRWHSARARLLSVGLRRRYQQSSYIDLIAAASSTRCLGSLRRQPLADPNPITSAHHIFLNDRSLRDDGNLDFQASQPQQAKCLMRGMDQSRNLSPPMESLPPALAERVGNDTRLPSREALSTFLSKQDLEWDFAAYLWIPVSRANNDDANAPLARYFVIHDTSGPNYGRRSFPGDVDDDTKINNLADFKCSDGWGKAHVVINRSGAMLLSHELSVPWRETKFEQAANFAGALKGLFLHVELIQPRRAAAGHSRRNDAQSPSPAFTSAQYDRLALVYVIGSVRAGHWLIPAFHAALDADIRNGHDDPLNFNADSLANSLEGVVKKLEGPRRDASRRSVVIGVRVWS